MNETHDKPANSERERPRAGGGWVGKLILLAVVVAVVAAIYWQFGGLLSLDALAAREEALLDAARKRPAVVLGAAFLIYVAISSLPVAAVFSMVIAWLCNKMFEPTLGQWPTLLIALTLVSFASTSGATLAFLMSRYLFRDAVQRRFGERLHKFNEALAREGAFYLFTLRLIPAVPFFAINLAMGLTPIRVWTYWWVSQVGMLAGTALYVYAGTRLPTLNELAEHGAAGVLNAQLIVAFVLLGVFPLAVKKLVGRRRPAEGATAGRGD